MQTSNDIVASYANVQRFETKPLADNERNAVAYFFMKLRIADPRFYDQAMPDEKTEKFTKREFSEFIRKFTKEKIDNGFVQLHKLLACGNPDYKFLTIQKVIGLIENGGAGEGVQAGAHRLFAPLALPDKTAEEKARKAGAQELGSMLSLVGAKPAKQVTDEERARAKAALEKAKQLLANKN